MKGIFEGMGGTSFEYNDDRNALAAHLRHNTYSFSGAKCITELQHFNSLLLNAEGKLRSFTEFRNAATDAGYRFNNTWLAAEYDNAVASSQMAVLWDELTRDNEYLEYITAGDNRVRPQHAILHGLTLHRDSPVWRKIWPPCDWGCRCSVMGGIKGNVTHTESQAAALGKQAVTNPLFERNSGLTKTAFQDNHPYFENAGNPERFDAVRNYGLPSIKRLYAANEFPAIAPMERKEDFLLWWRNQGKQEAGMVIKDKVGNSVAFNDRFRDHVAGRGGRWEYGSIFPDILQAPDEVWSQKNKGVLTIYHVKYFQDTPYVITTVEKDGKLTGQTISKLKDAAAVRSGALLYTK